MSNLQSMVQPFWNDTCVKPTPEEWHLWKCSFTNYLAVIPIVTPNVVLSEDTKLKLLQLHLGNEGKRIYEALNLSAQVSLKDALQALDKLWSVRVNTYVARYKFSQLKQAPGEDLDDFITRVLCATRQCDYASIPAKKIEQVLQIQQLIVGVNDQKIREALFGEDSSKLTWERACDIARAKADAKADTMMFTRHATDISRIRSIMPTPDTKKCYRCGSTQHIATNASCPARSALCRLCGKSGHFAKVCRSHKTVANINANCTEHDNYQTNSLSIYALHNLQTNIPFTYEPKLPPPDIRTVHFELFPATYPLQMELDSASPITIVPHSFYSKNLSALPLRPSNYTFGSYSQNIVHIIGFVQVTLFLESSLKTTVAVYISAIESKPLLGRNGMVALGVSPCITRMTIAKIEVSSLQSLYPTLFRDDIGRIPKVAHRIRLKDDAIPFSISQPRPIPLAKREAVSVAIKKMIQDDLIEPIQCSAWVHPLVAVQKKDGTVRICTDLRALNQHVLVDKFPLPSADELIAKLSGAKVFSKLDIRSAYFHMPLTVDSRPFTAFLTCDGLFQYKVLSMGFCSAPAAWQKWITQSLADLKGCFVYMDDICVFGTSSVEHDANLHAVLQRLNSMDLRLNIRKCQFATMEIEFLGHMISTSGLRPSDENIKAILECPQPTSPAEIKHFLGLCSYYLRHLPRFATESEPLRKLTRENVTFFWGPEQEEAYSKIRSRIASSPTVAIFDEKYPTIVSTDASDVGLGAVLSQIRNGEEKVVAYASRTLSTAEKNYSAGEKEALACVWACEKWHLYLFGRHFVLRTDHSALTTLLTRGNKGQKPVRISRWYSRLLNYDFEMKYVPGYQNQVADALSRLPLPNTADSDDMDDVRMVAALTETCPSAITLDRLREHTHRDTHFTKMLQFISKGWPHRTNVPEELRAYFPVRDELSIVNGCVMRGNRFVVPSDLIPAVLCCAHEGHPGIVRTKCRAREYFWWPNFNASVEAAVRNCNACQLSDKSAKPLDAPTEPIEYPMKPWAKVAIDIMGPFSKAPTNKRNILVATCFYSKWPEALLCGEVTTGVVMRWLRYLFARYGSPEEIVSDNGPQFSSLAFRQFLESYGIKHSKTVPYNPAANGMVERLNRSLKESMMAIQCGGEQWEDAIVTALATYRTTPHTATTLTPAELMLGRKIRTRLNAAFPAPEQATSEEWNRRRTYQSKYRKPGATCHSGTLVRIRKPESRKGESSLSVPIAVDRVLSPTTYILEDGTKVNARRVYTALSQRQNASTPRIEAPSIPEITSGDHLRRSTRVPKPVSRFTPHL